MKYLIILLSISIISCNSKKNDVRVGFLPTNASNGKSKSKTIQTLNFFAMGTPLSVKYISDKKEKILEQKILDLVKNFDLENSYYKENSYISQINKAKNNESIKLPLYFCNLLKISKEYFIKTEYKFNITYKSPKEFRNFDNLQINCDKNGHAKLDSVIKIIKKGTILDTGGIAKGLSIDKTGDLLKKEGYHNFLINYGGDILICGKKPNTSRLSKANSPRSRREFKEWKIGIKNPLAPDKLLKVIARKDVALLHLHENHDTKDVALLHLSNHNCYAVATSGDYERYTIKNGKKLSHIINPKTGKSIDGAHSITVIAKNATIADTLATAISVGHKNNDYIKRMKDKFNLEVYLLTAKDLKLRKIE